MASTGERNTTEREGRLFAHPMQINAVINRGTIVVLKAGEATKGHIAADLVAVGVADETYDASVGDTLAKAKLGTFLFANSPTDAIAAGDVGSVCFIEDDETVAKTDGAGTRSKAGTVRGLSGADVWVEFT